MNTYLLNNLNPYTNYVSDLQGLSDLGYELKKIYQWCYNKGRYKTLIAVKEQYRDSQPASKELTSIQTEASKYKNANCQNIDYPQFYCGKKLTSPTRKKVKSALNSYLQQQPKNKLCD